ncbi:MAG: hypothetical protein JNG90_16565, partial [Planctomycetaceae bacterium]|nr:hypothetical protein [Planctomycetaceae bacterium]
MREADLVALYPETAALPFTLQVYWSLACGELRGEPSLEIDLTVSLQTQQLDVRGRVACESWIATHLARYGRIADGVVVTPAGAGGGVLLPHENPPWIAAELLSARNHGQEDYDYFETAAPSDYLQVELTRGADAVRIRRPLLDEVME